MTGAEVMKMTGEEIGVELSRLRSKLHELRVQRTTEKVEDTSQLGKVRKDIARLHTRLNQMRATPGKPAAKAPAAKPAKTAAPKAAKSAAKAPKTAKAAKPAKA